MLAVELFGLEWQRAWALWGFILPAVVFLLARRPLRPDRLPTGALSFWRSVQESSTGGGGDLPKIPPAIWMLLFGLVFGVISLAGPKERSREASRTWHVIVDRSPAAYLKCAGDDASRMDAARALLEVELLGRLAGIDQVRWFDGEAWLEGLAFPAAWTSAPLEPLPAPSWSEHDLPGAVWLCSAVPPVEREAAHLCVGGARPCPGPVAIDGEDRLDWDVGGIERVLGAAPARSVALVGVKGAFAEFVTLWSEERGLNLNDDSPDTVEVLRVLVVDDGVEMAAGEWRTAPGALMFADQSGPALRGDAAEFALTWSRRLDELCLAAPGFASVGARSLSAEQLWASGRAPREDGGGGQSASRLEGWLALLSCCFVAAAMIAAAR